MDKRQRRMLEAEYERPDHWNYKTDTYELRKYEQTLALVPARQYERVLEIGCSEGVFTRRLASFSGHVLGLDIVPAALERARLECAGVDNVAFRQFDLESDTLDQQFDLIFCAEVLYYMRWTRLRPVARKIVRWLSPGGYLIAVHATNRVAADWGFGPKGAETTHRLFDRPGMRHVRDQDEGTYMLSLYQKVSDVPRPPWRDRLEDVWGQNYPALVRAVLRRALNRVRPQHVA